MTRLAWLMLALLLAGCATQTPPVQSDLQAVTPVPAQEMVASTRTLAPLPVETTVPLPPLPTCDDATLTLARANMPTYTPSAGAFVRLENNVLVANNQAIAVRGVIYEPRDTPGERLFTASTAEAVAEELTLIADAGFNTLRVHLYHDALFQCPGDGAIPVPDAFTRLDALIRDAAARGLRLMLVLHHEPDLTTYPLYDSPGHTTAQTEYLVRRYADEPAILAWDVRDSGDLDYTRGGIPREQVIAWLTRTTQALRQHAPNHLVTAGWNSDAAATAPFVDVVSFQQYGSTDELRQQIALLRTQTDQPLLLAGVGYPLVDGDELRQRDNLYEALLAAENNGLLGWAIFTAFDSPSDVCVECARFGLWNANYFPKLALDAPRQIIGE